VGSTGARINVGSRKIFKKLYLAPEIFLKDSYFYQIL
jgi:hypothetical protein